MGAGSIWHWIILLLIVVLLFGRGKISEVMGDVAKGIKSFKKGMADDDEVVAKSEDGKTIDHTATSAEKSAAER
ncbi:MAG: twin-arginine translocase TatA/TatE family subunit [Hyphomicrobiaceae bacterium]